MSTDTAIAMAKRLLIKHGEPVRFINEVTDGMDEDSKPIVVSTATYDGWGYPARYTAQDINGFTIMATDTRLICNRIQSRPAEGWRCVVDGETFRVMDVQKIRQSGKDIIYICQLRV